MYDGIKVHKQTVIEMKLHRFTGDTNHDYEIVANALIAAQYDWEKIRDSGLSATLYIEHTKSSSSQHKAFELQASQVCDNGQPVIAFAVYAGIYEGMKAVMKQTKLFNKPWFVCDPPYNDSTNFAWVVRK